MCYKMIAINVFFILLISPSFGIKFYEESKTFEYNCSVNFTNPKTFDCVCLTGVWRIFGGNNCDDSRTVGGSNYCTKLEDSYVSRVEKIIDDLQQIYFRFKNGSFTILSEDIDLSVINTGEIDSWVSAKNWTLYSADNVPVCLTVPESKYCLFSNVEITSISKIAKGCSGTAKQVIPASCNDIMSDGGNVCEGAKMQQGRVFLFAPGMKANIVEAGNVTVSEDDADYYEKANDSVVVPTTLSDDRVTSMIWNEVHKKLDVILHMTENVTKKGQDKRKKEVPLYRLLELCAEVMKVSCPSHYVSPDLLDLSVKIYNNLLRTQLNFGDVGMNYEAYMRVTNALNDCINRSTPFNFTKDYLCSENKTPEGNYHVYGFAGSVNIEESSIPKNREPIIETVWKMFYNAHSLCFDYFDESYNDHHRFTTILLPTFQTPVIQEIWTAPYLLTKQAIGGIFGNQETVQTNLAFCAASSRLESEYPWDLQRPKASKGKQKRSVHSSFGALDKLDSSQCSSKDITYCVTNL